MKKPTRILFAEDDKLYQQLYGGALERAGFALTYAENGELALKAMRKAKPDIIIADLIMPLVSGQTLLKKLKSSKVPILVLTALSGETDREDAMRNGADAFLCKIDVKPDDVVTAITELLAANKTPTRPKKHKPND